MFNNKGIGQHRPRFRSFRFRYTRAGVGSLRPRPIRLILETLESRIEPSPFTPTGALGDLAPTTRLPSTRTRASIESITVPAYQAAR